MAIDVLESSRFVIEQSDSVSIREEKIPPWVREHLAAPVPDWDSKHHFFDGSAQTVAYCLLLDALNFCFFPDPRWEVVVDGEHLQGYFALAAVLKRTFQEHRSLDNFAQLAKIDVEAVRRVLQGSTPIGQIPLLEERAVILREIGERISYLYNGNPTHLVKAARGSALALLELIVETFPSFRDEVEYAGEQIAFYKRAQIFIADLFDCFHGTSYGAFRDIDRLTAFADYKLPQILRAEDILSYATELAGHVDQKRWLEAGSRFEVEIRAAVVVTVDLLRREFERQGRSLLPIEVDWMLWQVAQEHPNMAPHHRTLTIFY
jgi:hypothetical protein